MRWFAMAMPCFMAALLVACDGGGGAQTTSGQAADAQRGRAGARDLAAINVCALVPDATVSQILEMRVAQAGTRRNHGIYTQGCEYGLQSPGGRPGYHYVVIDLQPTGIFGSLDEALQTARTMGQHVTGERVVGVGSDAYAIDNQMEQSVTLHVLLREGVAVQVRADSLEHAMRLARAAEERLSAGG
jgi:hypothetical protein